jgi:hypothetical protein
MKVRCHPCDQWMDVASPEELEDDIRVVHPELFSPLERWPDGAIVLHDETLTSKDFTEGGKA